MGDGLEIRDDVTASGKSLTNYCLLREPNGCHGRLHDAIDGGCGPREPTHGTKRDVTGRSGKRLDEYEEHGRVLGLKNRGGNSRVDMRCHGRLREVAEDHRRRHGRPSNTINPQPPTVTSSNITFHPSTYR